MRSDLPPARDPDRAGVLGSAAAESANAPLHLRGRTWSRTTPLGRRSGIPVTAVPTPRVELCHQRLPVHQRPLRRNGCRGKLPPTDHPGTSFQWIACAVPSACPNCRRLTANRGLKRVATPRSIKRSATVDCPHQVGSQADSAGSIPATRSTRDKRCSTSEFDCISQAGQRSFASETALVPLRVPIGHLGECPWRLSVPKLTVRLRFPSPAPHAKRVAAEPCPRVSGLSDARFGPRPGHFGPHLSTPRDSSFSFR